MKAKTYYSNASWSKIKDTQDGHSLNDTSEKNLAYARAICESLFERWGPLEMPCSVRGTCTRTWISDETGKEIEEVSR
jgi:hypothetical protein